jgi:hypothetical protein
LKQAWRQDVQKYMLLMKTAQCRLPDRRVEKSERAVRRERMLDLFAVEPWREKTGNANRRVE